MKYLYPLTLLFCLCFAGCASVPELLSQGKFETAYAKARKHCTRGRAPNLKKINQFLDAYAAVQARDYQQTKDVSARSGSQKWAELYEIYDDLHGRSIDLLKIAPRAIDLKKYPHLLPAELEARREDARKKAGAYYLALTDPLLENALAGDKPSAREAWELHQQVAYFLPERDPEFSALRANLRNLGTLRILVYAPQGEFAEELTRSLAYRKDVARDWTEILTHDNGKRIDLEAELLFTEYTEDWPQETCHTSNYDTEVLDYVEQKKVTERINDSTVVEKTIEIEHYKTVYASVTECEQTAGMTANGEVRVYQWGSDRIEWSAIIESWTSWSNKYSVGSGDSRALPAFANWGMASFSPGAQSMLAEAIDYLPVRAITALTKRYAPKEPEQRKEKADQ